MKPNIKKLLILNAPYLLFVWLFMKIGEAFRLSPGADLSGKLLHIMEGVTAAFESPMPSLNGQDFLIGVMSRLLSQSLLHLTVSVPSQGNSKRLIKQSFKQFRD